MEPLVLKQQKLQVSQSHQEDCFFHEKLVDVVCEVNVVWIGLDCVWKNFAVG